MSNIGQHNEARSTNFLFSIGLDTNLTFAAQTANVTELTLPSAPFYTGAKDIKVPSNKVEYAPLIFDLIVSEDYNEWITVFKWMMQCKNNTGSPMDPVRSCRLTQLTAQNQEGISFLYLDAWPTSIEGIQYAANDDNSTVLTTTVTLEYNKFKVVLPNGEELDEQYTR